MATFQKPENALKRAEGLIEVDKKQDALDTLHAAITHKKFKNLWTTTLEQIMIKELELCVELKKTRTAREALHQYRTTCQAANVGSLELVVQKLRTAAESKVSEARNKSEAGRMADMEDLDEMEAPQTILLRAIQAQDTRQQSQDRDVHMHFRFLWDTYKVILDVLKSNARLEEVYHETARHAFDFCRQNKRPQEFKRLCETLRKYYQELQKKTGAIPAHQVNPNNADTVTRTLETRCRQLQIATELDLWREAYVTATEIYELMNKVRKPHLRSMYYEYLGQIFWKSENYLFHAFACLKNLVLVKALKQNLSEDERKLLASRAVLATLCVPFQSSSDLHATLELTTESASSPYEKAKKHAHLFNAQMVPTRDTIIAQLAEKNLLSLAPDACCKLFNLIESDFTPLSLCQDAKPFLEEIAKEDLCEGRLAQYVAPLKQIIFFRLVKQLSEVYANMTIENFEKAASIVPFSIAEKWLAQAAKAQGINVQINYREQAIIFGASRKVDMKSMRQPLIEIGYKLQQAMQRIAPEEQMKKEKMEKQQLSQNIVDRIEEESRQIRARKEEIERRKEESEKRKEQQEREAHEKLKKQEEKEQMQERQRQEEERKRREQEREEQKRKDAEQKKKAEELEQMRNKAGQKERKLIVDGKKINVVDIDKLSLNQIEKAKEAQEQRERQERIRHRKLEAKRVDHLARALREEEMKRVDDWARFINNKDDGFWEQEINRLTRSEREKHEEQLQEKRVVEGFLEAVDNWRDDKLQERWTQHEDEDKQRYLRAQQKVVELKIQRAKQRKAEYDAAQRKQREEEERQEAEERRREEQEKAQQREEAARREREEREAREREEEEARLAEKKAAEEAKKKEREEQRKKDIEAADRAAAKAREREREIEERQKQRQEEDRREERRPDRDDDRRRPGKGGGGRGGMDDDWRRGPERSERDRDRGTDSRNLDDDGPRRRPPPRTAADEEFSWRRGPDRDRDEPKEEEPPRERPRLQLKKRGEAATEAAGGSAATSAPPERATAPPRVSKPPPRAEPERAEPAPAAKGGDDGEDDGGGWETAVKSKKGRKAKDGDGAAPAGGRGDAGGEDIRQPPPWKSASSSRTDWKNKSQGEDPPREAKPAPWRRS